MQIDYRYQNFYGRLAIRFSSKTIDRHWNKATAALLKRNRKIDDQAREHYCFPKVFHK